LTKALDFSWATTMALLFLGAKDHRITALDLTDLENHLPASTSRHPEAFWNSIRHAKMPRLLKQYEPPRSAHMH